MKIDRKRPLHWLLLVGFLAQAILGLLLRHLRRRRAEDVVVLYGHKLNGNLFALHEELRHRGSPRAVFLTMDGDYRRQLQAQGFDSCHACSPACARLLAIAGAVVSDHGLHSLELLQPAYRRAGLGFFDVWHGIPFKGFDADDFRVQHRYDETWVASGLCRQLYVDRFGFEPTRVVATGYPRTDRLVTDDGSGTRLREELGISDSSRVVLFAPTWAQDQKGRSIYPFGHTEAEFLSQLSAFVRQRDATLLVRSHLNSGDGTTTRLPGMIQLPGSRYPDTEGILLASDVLVCDWSSIAFDYLLLDRPTLFLDVPPPFRKGFSLGPEYRFGPVVPSLPALLEALGTALDDEEGYWQAYRASHTDIRARVYGRIADGAAARRCTGRLAGYMERSG